MCVAKLSTRPNADNVINEYKKTFNKFFKTYDPSNTARSAAQRFALPALGRAAERRPTGKMLRRRKMLGIAPESPASGARFVRLPVPIIHASLALHLLYFDCNSEIYCIACSRSGV
jgi:hypothetical protein